MAEPYAGGDSDGAESTTVYSARIVEDRTVHDTANGSSDAVTTAHSAVSVTQDPEHVKPKEYVCFSFAFPFSFLSGAAQPRVQCQIAGPAGHAFQEHGTAPRDTSVGCCPSG